MTREKRGLEPADGDDQLRDPKRPRAPALASVIVEALKVDSLQRLCSSLEPILRRVVSEEVERALAKLGPARITGSTGRASPKRIEGPDGRNLQLQFRSRLSLPLFTGGKVEGEQGAAIHVVLLDATSGLVVTSGPESYAKLDIVVLEGDFNNEDDENWSEEEFESHVVKEREGKRPLLTGDLQVTLREGVGTLGELTFTDNSSWIRSRKFRLGLRISSGFCEGIRIREAKTEAFIVKDHRGELYKKHYPPSWKDDVWRLEKIGKDGSFHKKLNKSGIRTVEDFLRLYVRDPQKLRSILGSGMSNKMWDSLIEHAKTCPLSGTYYVFYADDTRGIGAIFNQIFEFAGLIANSQFYSAESLADNQKVYADTLVKKAYDNWGQVVEYDGKVLLGLKTNEKTVATRSDLPDSTTNNPSLYDHASQHVSVSFQQPLIDTALANRGEAGPSSYNSNQVASFSRNAPQVASTGQVQYGNTSFASAEQFNVANTTGGSLNSMDLALGQQSNLMLQPVGQPMSSGNVNSYFDWPHRENQVVDEYHLTEDEIRLRSNEILENDEMQQLLRHLNYAGASNNLTDDTYGYQSFMQSPALNFGFEDDQNRSAGGKAVVGWLKIKAAMRWGIFIRKKAAERRRAQLVELDD